MKDKNGKTDRDSNRIGDIWKEYYRETLSTVEEERARDQQE